MRTPSLLFLIALMFFGGCASVTKQHMPTFIDWDTGKKVRYTSVSMTEINFVAPTKSVTVFLVCDAEGDEEKSLENTKCRLSDAGREHMTPGLVTVLGPTVINSAGRLGAARLRRPNNESHTTTVANNADNSADNSNENTNEGDFTVQQNIANDGSFDTGANYGDGEVTNNYQSE